MRLSQDKEKNVLLSVGLRENKIKLKQEFEKLGKLNYKIYATYKTHKFLKRMGIEAILVHKVSEKNVQPHLEEMLQQNRFDLIINIPTGTKQKEKTDGQVIREYATKHNVKLITEIEVAKNLIEKLEK
jgi:vacuolar-type H+-ATPase subunit F/Vma7